MMIKDGFIVRKIVDEILIVPVGERISDFNGLVSINETGLELWEKLKEDTTQEALVEHILSDYNVDRKTAEEDVAKFLDVLRKNELIIE